MKRNKAPSITDYFRAYPEYSSKIPQIDSAALRHSTEPTYGPSATRISQQDPPLGDFARQQSQGVAASPSITQAITTPDSVKNTKHPRGAESLVSDQPLTDESCHTSDEQVVPLDPEETTPSQPRGSSKSDQTWLADIAVERAPHSHSGQRAIKNGEVYIMDSDGDSDASLEDLDAIIHQRQDSPDSKSKNYLPLPDTQYWRDKSRGQKRGPSEPSAATKRIPRISLEHLVSQTKRYESCKEISSRIQSRTKEDSPQKDDQTVQTNDLAGLMADQGDHANDSRLKLAIQRTEGLHQEPTWSFFERLAEPHRYTKPPVLNWLGSPRPQSSASSIEQMLLAGFTGELAINAHLSDEVLDWILSTAATGVSSDTRHACINLVKQVPEQIASGFGIERLLKLFRTTGATAAALQIDVAVQPGQTQPEIVAESENLVRFNALIEILQAIGPWLSRDNLVQAICILCRSLMDSTIANNGSLLSRIEIVLTNLLHQLTEPTKASNELRSSDLFHLLTRLYHTTSDVRLQVSLLHNLPTSSMQWLQLRRQLAVAWFLSITPDDTNLSKSSFFLQEILAQLQSPAFAPIKNLDFAHFTCSIQILDIALDMCDRPCALHTSPTRDHYCHLDRQFDAQIDVVASRIKTIFLQIIDNGAGDMRRAEAKEALEMMRARLLYSVRIRPPLTKKVIWNKSEDAEAEMRNVMQRWIQDNPQDGGLKAEANAEDSS